MIYFYASYTYKSKNIYNVIFWSKIILDENLCGPFFNVMATRNWLPVHIKFNQLDNFWRTFEKPQI